MMAVQRHTGNSTRATMQIRDDRMTLRVADADLTAPVLRFTNGERSAIATLAELAVRAGDQDIDLRACASCKRFWFSGLSFQFSGGTRGYCALAGGRDRESEVDIDFGCGEHERIDGWPADMPAADRARMELRMAEPAPPRLPAFEGALLGLAAGATLTDGTAHHGILEALEVGAAVAAVQGSVGVAEAAEFARQMKRQLDSTARAVDPVGAVMLATTVGLITWREPARTRELAGECAAVIDGPEGADVAVVASLVAMAMRKRTAAEMRRDSGLQGDASDAVRRAFDCFEPTQEDYSATVAAAQALEHGAASIAGALAGAFNGVQAIPEAQRRDLPDVQRLLEIAGRLFAQRGRR